MIGYLTRLLQNKELQNLVENKTIVVKLGGSMLSQEQELLDDIVALSCAGARLVVVHGGGPSINKALASQGVVTKKIQGLRVTDDAALPVVASVLTGINAEVKTALSSLGLLAEGFVPPKQPTLAANKLLGTTQEGDRVDIGWVGDIQSVDKLALSEIISQGGIPVIAPLGIDSKGQMYNINADSAAAAVARALKADFLMLVTDVPGVLARPEDPSSILHTVTTTAMKELIETGAITGGMLPKLASCVEAIEHGVGQVHILDGHGDRPLATAFLSPEATGTRIVRAA